MSIMNARFFMLTCLVAAAAIVGCGAKGSGPSAVAEPPLPSDPEAVVVRDLHHAGLAIRFFFDQEHRPAFRMQELKDRVVAAGSSGAFLDRLQNAGYEFKWGMPLAPTFSGAGFPVAESRQHRAKLMLNGSIQDASPRAIALARGEADPASSTSNSAPPATPITSPTPGASTSSSPELRMNNPPDQGAIQRAAARHLAISESIVKELREVQDLASFERAQTKISGFNAELDSIARDYAVNGITFTLRGIPPETWEKIHQLAAQELAEGQRLTSLPDGAAIMGKTVESLNANGPSGIGRVKWKVMQMEGSIIR